MLYLYQSNRLEELAHRLARVQNIQPLEDIFAPECIVIQSQGMRRYISQFLAQEMGIAANLKFMLPAGLAWKLMRLAVPNAPELSPFSSEVMRWRLLQLFQSSDFQQPHFQAARTVLNDYLNNGDYAAYQLAGQLADVLDQYLVYRPHWLEAWAANQEVVQLKNDSDAAWQAHIWRYLDDGKQNVPHRVQLWRALMKHLEDEQFTRQLPERYFVFGIATIAPMYLKLLEQIAIHRDVFIFALNPSAKEWGDVIEPTQILKLDSDIDLTAQGHPLLASMGKQARDFFNELNEANVFFEASIFDEAPRSDSLLHTIQYQIQQQIVLDDPNSLNDEAQRMRQKWQQDTWAQLSIDNSIQIHSTHSPLRELQVLKEQILKLLNQNPDLQPHQIAVLVPHIEPYAPYIEAVFGKHSGDFVLPYTLSDVKLSRHQALLDALEQTFLLLDSRFEANKLLALLDNQLILDKFQISREDLPLLYETVRELNIRWGNSAADRDNRNNLFTWQQGLNRLILGFMLPENRQNRLWQNIASYTSHPDHMGVLSSFSALITLLSQTKTLWQKPATVSQWCERIRQLVCQLVVIAEDDDHQAWQQLEQALTQWQNETDTAHFTQNLSLGTAVQHMKRFLHSQSDAGFLRGGITFCSMIPMRSLPFEVICLLGMNDGEMPRQVQANSFDLISRYPQKGDRTRRDDDKYLFLEMLLSARRVFYISYIGKDIRTDQERAASSLVGEVIDTVFDLTQIPSSELKQDWVIQHPLQPFSRKYFSGSPKLSSTRQDYADALNNPVLQNTAFVGVLPESSLPKEKEVSQNDFLKFWRSPVKTWLQRSLNWQAPYTHQEHDVQEPFLPDNPRQLADVYLRARRNHEDFDDVAQTLVAQSLLPTDKLGELVQQEYAQAAANLPSHLLNSPKLPELGDVLYTDSGSLNYRLPHIYQDGQILFAEQFLNRDSTNDTLNWTDKMNLLLHHLIFCAVTPDDAAYSRQTHYLSLFEQITLPEMAQNKALSSLQMWLTAYHIGQNVPLPFFPRLNLNVAITWFNDKERNWNNAIKTASQVYYGGHKSMAIADYAEAKIVFGRDENAQPPYDSALFKHLTQNLFEVFADYLYLFDKGK